MKLKLLAATAAIIASAAAAYAGGAFSNYPIVSVPAGTVCLSYGNNGVCNQFNTAAPALTGAETIPADTNAAGGAVQTVAIPVTLLGAGATQYATPATGATVTVTSGTSLVLLEPAGTIATLTVVLPAASTLLDGQTLRLTSSQTVTALTLTAGSGTTISNAPSAITVSATAPYNYEFAYKASTAKWYRTQ